MRLYNRLGGLLAATGLIVISYHDVLLQAAVEAKEKGMTWGLLVPVWIAANKLYRGKQFSDRDRRWEGKLDAIGEAVGAWKPKTLQPVPMNSNGWLPSFSAAFSQVGKWLSKRRIKKMQINWVTLIPALVGAIKLILQPFGIDLTFVTDEKVNDIANGVAALAAIIGILATNRKAPKEDDVKLYTVKKGGVNLEEHYGDHGPAV